MFAIYPTIDATNAREHAVVFCEDIDIARRLCEHFEYLNSVPHSAFLVMPSWPDPQLVHNLNGCHEDVAFSVRDPHAAERASHICREALKGFSPTS